MKSIKELAKELGVSERTIRRYMDKLKVKAIKQGNKLQFDEDAQTILIKAVKNSFEKNIDNLDNDNIDKCDNVKQPKNGLNYDKCDNNNDNIDNLDNDNVDKYDNVKQPKNGLNYDKCDNCDKLKLYENKAEMLQSQLEQSQKQIEQMQKNIDSLNYDKEQLYKQIDTLSTALTTAQALQGIEKKQNLLVVGADAEEQPQQKQGFFARLFRRNK